jgi:hypothetical protein
MGAFWKVCPDCQKPFMWFSFTPETIRRGERCEDCWERLVSALARRVPMESEIKRGSA